MTCRPTTRWIDVDRPRAARTKPAGSVHLRAGLSRPGDSHDPPRSRFRPTGHRLRRDRAAQGGRVQKLERVVRFAMGSACRQQEILRYFGETNADRCGHCDNCRLPGAKRSEIRGQGPEFSRRVHAGRNRHQGAGNSLPTCRIDRQRDPPHRANRAKRRGPRRPVSPAAGTASPKCSAARTAQVKKLGLHRLSTFGLLKHLKQDDMQVELLLRLLSSAFLFFQHLLLKQIRQ